MYNAGALQPGLLGGQQFVAGKQRVSGVVWAEVEI